MLAEGLQIMLVMMVVMMTIETMVVTIIVIFMLRTMPMMINLTTICHSQCVLNQGREAIRGPLFWGPYTNY